MEDYELIRQIGKGAFGSAHIVENRNDHKRYVLKRVRLARQTPRERQASLQEIQLLSQMHHRNVLAYTKSWVDKGFVVCIVVELCEGGDLRTQLQLRAGRMFAESDILEMFVQMVSALDYMHSNCVMHRDIKTSNILIAGDGRLVLADFGLSTVLESPDAMTSTLVGTPGYMCPQLLMRQPYGTKADIWALGCVFFEISSLKPAFDAFNMAGLVKKVCQGPTPVLSGNYSEDWRATVKSMLTKEPEARPTAAELLALPFLQPTIARVEAKWGRALTDENGAVIQWEAPPTPIARLAERFRDQEAEETLRRHHARELERKSSMARSAASAASTRSRPRSAARGSTLHRPPSAAVSPGASRSPSPRRVGSAHRASSAHRATSAPHIGRHTSNILLKKHRDSLEMIANLGPIEDGESAFIAAEYCKHSQDSNSSSPSNRLNPPSPAPDGLGRVASRVRFNDHMIKKEAIISRLSAIPQPVTPPTADDVDGELVRQLAAPRSLSEPEILKAEDDDDDLGGIDVNARLTSAMDSLDSNSRRRTRSSHSGENDIHFHELPLDSNLSRLAAAAALGGSPRMGSTSSSRNLPHYMLPTKASQPRLSAGASRALLMRAQSKMKVMDGANLFPDDPPLPGPPLRLVNENTSILSAVSAQRLAIGMVSQERTKRAGAVLRVNSKERVQGGAGGAPNAAANGKTKSYKALPGTTPEA